MNRLALSLICAFRLVLAKLLSASGDGEIRTLDPLLARQVLSQLSYTPTLWLHVIFTVLVFPLARQFLSSWSLFYLYLKKLQNQRIKAMSSLVSFGRIYPSGFKWALPPLRKIWVALPKWA